MKTPALVRPGSGRWSALVFVASVLLLAIGGYVYTNHVQRQSERHWCTLLNLLVDTDQPPQTDRARQIYDAVQDQRREFGC